MKRPITLYLIGFAGIGKYTIAKEIAKSDYKVVDNHLINNPIFSLLDLDGGTPIPESARTFTRKIRHIILDFVSQDLTSNYVFTNELLEHENDRKVYTLIKETAEKRYSLFIPVKLTISPEEHEKRITSPERVARFKTINAKEVHRDKKLMIFDHPHLLEVDVTNLSSAQAAQKIFDFAKDAKSAQ